MSISRLRLLSVCAAILSLGVSSRAYEIILHTDADAHVQPKSTHSAWPYNYGASTTLAAGGYYDNHDVTYLHFDLSGLPRRKVITARLKLDRSWHGWTGSGSASQRIQVFGLMDDSDEWDPATNPEGIGTGQDTVAADIAGDNAPARGPNGPTLNDEGSTASSASRLVAEQDCIRDTTPTEGYAIDVDITDFLNWVLGNDTTYSTYTNENNHLTIAVHLQYRGSYPYLRAQWYSTEHTPTDPSDAPRLEIEYPPGGTVVVFR